MSDSRAQIREMSGAVIVEFPDSARLDPAPVRQLRMELESLRSRVGHANVIVDLRGVEFAGSATLGGFVAIQRDCGIHGGRIVLCNVDPTVREVFRVTHLDTLFHFVPDTTSALAAVARPG